MTRIRVAVRSGVVAGFLALLSSACGGSSSGAPTSPTPSTSPLVGTWRGSISQTGVGTYTVSMTFQSATAGTIAYGSPLNCSGTVTGIGVSGEEHRFSESITTNPAACVPGGTIRVQVTGNSMSWRWDWPAIFSGLPALTTTLTKQ